MESVSPVQTIYNYVLSWFKGGPEKSTAKCVPKSMSPKVVKNVLKRKSWGWASTGPNKIENGLLDQKLRPFEVIDPKKVFKKMRKSKNVEHFPKNIGKSFFFELKKSRF